MTGKDLIIYILRNNLENEQIFENGKPIGFISTAEAAVKFNVGIPTIYAWIDQGKLDFIVIGNEHFVSDICEIKDIGERNNEK